MEDINEFETGPWVNELLQVRLPDDENPGNYRSRIDDIVEKKLLVTWPTEKGVYLPLHVDQMLNFSVVRDSNAYAFSGLVDTVAQEPKPVVSIIVSSPVERIQRRQDFRVKCLIPLEVVATPAETSVGLQAAALTMKTATYDLSASGISLRTAKLIPEGTLPDIKIALPDGGPTIETTCKVVHCFAPPENPNKFHIGIKFQKIEENNKARIVRFIYRTQLKSIRC